MQENHEMLFGHLRNKSSRSSAPGGLGAAAVGLAVAILGYSPQTWAAALAESAVFHLVAHPEDKESTQRVAPGFKKSYGKYLGSGTGDITGMVSGSVVWDLYEEQSDPKLHRTQFVGRITSSDGSTVSFETTGYFTPRLGGEHWDLTSAVYFSDAKGAAYRELVHRIAPWQGHVDIRTDADAHTTYSHTYTLYLAATKSPP